MEKLSDQDKAMIVYFWEEKGDLTRWCSWEEKKPMVEEEFPELIKALKDFDIAKKMISLTVRSISETVDF